MVNWPDSKSGWPARLCTAADEPESGRDREGVGFGWQGGKGGKGRGQGDK